jgi:predicted esterase
MYINRVIKVPSLGAERRVVVLLTGRGVPADYLIPHLRRMNLSDTVGVVVEPRRLAWYPPPNGPEDQKMAVWGLSQAVPVVLTLLDQIRNHFNIPAKKMVVGGFSAGAVVANQLVAHGSVQYAACVSMGGAILEPERLPHATHQTPFILQHNLQDSCFSWHERYMPMRDGLKKRGFVTIPIEEHLGGHDLYRRDAVSIGKELARLF